MGAGPVVVAVLSHRDPPLLRRLVDRVHEGDETVVVLHHDPRGEPHGLTESDRLVLVPDPQPCSWGRIDLARAVLRCLEVSQDRFPALTWALLVSGQDYPARHVRAVEADLRAQRADALLRFFPVDPRPGSDVHPWQARCRQRYLHRMRLPGTHRSVPFPRRHPFRDGTSLFIGDMWANLSGPAVAHVLEQRQRMQRVESYLARCSVPDEALLPTLLLNGAEDLDVVSDRRRYIRWREGQPHPEWLTAADVDAVQRTDDWFCRKVDSVRTPDVLRLLDEAAVSPPRPDR